ncbi:MAG: hypothetical protein R2747_19280 [Pyrinomonadaceae bacterium]
MRILGLMIFLVFGFAQNQDKCSKKAGHDKAESATANQRTPVEKKDTKYDRLPDGVKLTDEVREETLDEKGEKSFRIITVEEKLKQLKAAYEGDKLVDDEGREIKFYRPPVRGASQGYEEDQKQRERDEEELRELKEKFTVIILYVNPLKVG